MERWFGAASVAKEWSPKTIAETRGIMDKRLGRVGTYRRHWIAPALPILSAPSTTGATGNPSRGAMICSRAGEESALNRTDAERVQQALDAAIDGDVEPFVALLAPDLEWRGVERGHLWWRRTPS